MKASFFLASACSLILSPAYGQLYLIQGSPTPKNNLGYPTTLLDVGPDGAVRAVSELLPGSGSMGGAEWIGVSYGHRKAVLLPKSPSHTVVVVDFDTASVAKKCETPPAPPGMSSSPFEEWLADIPGKGLVYVEHYGTADMRKLERGHLGPDDYALRGMLVDPSVPCDRSFMAVQTNDIKFLVDDGQTGVADLGSWNTMDVGIAKNGVPSVGWFGGERTYFDYRLPDELMGDLARTMASVVVNNSQVLGVVLSDPTNGRLLLLPILRKGDGTWHTVPGLGARVPFVRGFGSFVAFAETQPKTAQNPESAGHAEWRKAESATGPSIEARLKNLPYVLPGKLDLYDAATEKTYSIVTSQGDSEILLVHNSTVYYRVSDRLYSATIGEDGLGPARLISTSESIRDVHWAFIKD